MSSLKLSMQATDEQVLRMEQTCAMSEQLLALTLAKRIHNMSSLDSIHFILDWFRTVRSMAQANLMASGIKYDVVRDVAGSVSKPEAAPNVVKEAYPDGRCPDCGEPIPDNVVDGQECKRCEHTFVAFQPTDDVLGVLGKNNLGMEMILFKDSGHHLCALQQSFSATEPTLAIGFADEDKLLLNKQRMADLLARLTAWQNTGSFRMDSDPV